MILKRPLLAAKVEDEDLKRMLYPVETSPKIDGIRALVTTDGLVSRSLKRIPNRYCLELFERPELEGLDGELCVGSSCDSNLMQKTMSGIMSRDGQPDVSYHVFDKWNADRDFIYRFREVERIVTELNESFPVIVVPHKRIHSYEELLEEEQRCLLWGYEGLMIRKIHGRYKQGRSSLNEGILLKLKRFQDGEFEILGYSPIYRNYNEQTKDERGYAKRSSEQSGKVADELLGSLHVRDLEGGKEFDIGSGFTEAQRYDLWAQREALIGQVGVYKSFNIGVKDLPRFPIFKSLRSRLDMS